MKLSQYAKKLGITYRTAFSHYQAGLIAGAYALPTGTIIVPDDRVQKPEYTVIYARVSCSERKNNLDTQAQRLCEFCTANGWQIDEVVKECASGLNDKRPKLQKILKDKKATRIIIEHQDRLTRFGFNYIQTMFDGQIIIVNPQENKTDLMEDFVSLVTCFCARLYGQRRTKSQTEKLIQKLNENNS